MKYFALAVLCIFTLSATSQNNYNKSDIFSVPKSATIELKNIKTDWAPKLQNLEAPYPGTNSYRNYLELLKKDMKKDDSKSLHSYKISSSQKPILLNNFDGNPYNFSVPTDNDVAISNDGKLISVVNTNISIYDVILDTLLQNITLQAFSDTLNISAGKFDPKVLYDPKLDKFIMIYLSGSSSGSTNIIVAFSQTNDPLGKWNFYAIPGNPFMNTTWSDYPIVAITDDELFITVNLIRDNESWQLGFDQSLIWQVDKNSGFTGQNLDMVMHSGISFEGKPIRNLCPIQGGSTTYGPNIYFLSNRNFDMENDTIFIIELTGKIDDPTSEVLIDFSIADIKYGVPPNAAQPNNTTLQTNDARILGGFYENGQIHFSGNTRNISGNNLAAVYHGIIDDIDGNRTISGYVIGDSILDFGYPNISYSGRFPGDVQAILTFNHSSADTFPGVSSVFYNSTDNHSERVSIKTGTSWVNVLAGTNERWGDYSGTQRKYDDPGKVWMSGFYGTSRVIFGNTERINGTWIAELESPGSPEPPVGIENIQRENKKIAVYPNPFVDIFSMDFTLEQTDIINISIVDLSGKQVKLLYSDKANKGLNRFSFSTKPLTPGVYILLMQNENEIISETKLVVN